ncbi:MAG: 50S ribosomal protein L6 [Actinobacteria bacterium]|nr:50S ribosomal protein L6 [Actinomycetota bacterium]
MSRIGKAPITVPSGVEVKTSGNSITVKGPKGTLSRELVGGISVRQEENTLVVERSDDERTTRSLHGLSRALLNNMIVGVTQGFSKELEIVGVGYRAELKGSSVIRLNLGFSHPIDVTAPAGVTFEVPVQTRIIINGIDKETVGQVAANIRSIRKPEPYKGKGVRYLDERILRKAGKAGKK